MEKLVSIIIPVYNVEKYIEQCIYSVINQTYKNIEIIIINDGSTDCSIEKISKIKDERITIITQENKGLSAARNEGIQQSKGDYISFVDSDDFISRKYIETFVYFIEKYDVDIVCCESIDFLDGFDKKAEEQVNSITCIEDISIDIFNSETAIVNMFYQKPSITGTVLKLYKRKLMENFSFPNGRYYEDLATTYILFQMAGNIAFLSPKMYAYRFRNTSIMSRGSEKKIQDCLWLSKKINSDFYNKNHILRNAAWCAIFRINRIVSAQTKMSNKQFKFLWNNIKTYRKSVLLNTQANKRDRILAASAFGGSLIFKICISFFGKARYVAKKLLLYR